MDNLVNIIKVLNKIGQEGVENAQRELGTTRTIRGRKVRRVSSDTLRKSLQYKAVKRGNAFRIDFTSKTNYGDFIHEGVNGTKLKVGSKYSFKKPMINVSAVKGWIKNKPIRLRDKSGQFLKNTPQNLDRAAFAIAKSIAEKGIVGVPYFTLGVERAIKKNEKALEQAMLKDLDINIKL